MAPTFLTIFMSRNPLYLYSSSFHGILCPFTPSFQIHPFPSLCLSLFLSFFFHFPFCISQYCTIFFFFFFFIIKFLSVGAIFCFRALETMLKNNSVAMATITANSSLHQIRTSSTSDNRNSHPRDAFISPSYLNSKEERPVAESGRHVRSSFTSNRGEHLHLQLAEKKERDGDIGVFEAHKYFNGGMDIESPRVVAATTHVAARQYQYQHKDEEPKALETRNLNKSHYGTPSVRSESSWNSQSKLLPRVQRNPSRKGNNKIQKKSFLAGLGCKCSCADNNSVDISDHNHTPTYGVVHGKGAHKNILNTGQDADYSAKTNKVREELMPNKDVCFKKPDSAFSSLTSGLENQLVHMKLQEKEEEKPRKSLEVFGSPILNNRRSLTFDKRHTMPSWDAAAAPKVEEIDIFSGNYNDTESDASSDLFEIDSLTGKTNHFLNRQTSDVASGCASPTTCYAPSEASIEWSVATASAADFSVLSDGEEQSTVATMPTKAAYYTPSAGTTKVSREIQRQRRHSSTLLGCKSYKAVRVAGDAFITYEKPNHSPLIRRRSDTLAQVTRFKVDPKMGNFGAIHGQQHAYAARPPLQRSYSSHVSQPLYI